ncbi:MAG: helix-turn-helix domain-containing protein [Aeoliella sp.]
MQKKYIVRLTAAERQQCEEVVDKLKGTSQKVKRANILLKADVNGPAWTDQQIADAFRCRRQTVENVRKKCVLEGFQQALEHKQQTNRKPKTLDGEQEAQVIAMRLGKPPKGYGRWTLRLLARKAVELEVVEAVSHETVRQTLKKTA